MKDFCIIGSGISGATIANALSKKYTLDVYDKARGVGGRSSNKKFNKSESFDHGVQYISPKSSKFKRFIENLTTKKIVKKWPGKHLFLIFISSVLKMQLISFNRYLLIELFPLFPIILTCFLFSFLSLFKNTCFPRHFLTIFLVIRLFMNLLNLLLFGEIY